MALTMAGVSGQLRISGRIAYHLGKWDLTPQTDGAFVCHAYVDARDEYWASQLADGRGELILDIRNSRWRWRGVTVSGDKHLRVAGSGKPEVL